MWGFFPPAVSDVFLASVVARLVPGERGGLEKALCTFLGSRAAAAGSSWVVVLGMLLEQVAARQPDRREVVTRRSSQKPRLVLGFTQRSSQGECPHGAAIRKMRPQIGIRPDLLLSASTTAPAAP